MEKLSVEYTEVFGFKMYLDKFDQGGYSLIKNKFPEELLFIKNKLEGNEKNIFVDVGANIGYFTLFFASLNPTAKIYSFEPNPDNFKILQKNIDENHLSNITCYNCAVGSEKKTVKMKLSEQSGQHQINDSGDIEIECVKLDDIITKINFIKIDVEGYEGEVLKGMKNLLQTNLFLMIEFYYKLLKNNDEPIKLLKELEKNNFQLIDMRDNFRKVTINDLLTKYDENSGATDLFCYKN